MTSNGINVGLNGCDSGATFLLSNVRNRELFELISYNFPPDLYFFCWRGYSDIKKQDIGMYFEEFNRKHVVFQAMYSLSRIRIGAHVINLFDPPTSGEKAQTHEILYQKFPLTRQGKTIWSMAEEDGLWEKLLKTPKAFLMTTKTFTEYFNCHYFFDEEAQITEYQARLKIFRKQVKFSLPEEGQIVSDDDSSELYHFMSFCYVDSNKKPIRLLKEDITFLRVNLYCGECQQLKRLYFSIKDLKVHDKRGDEHHYLCYHDNNKPSFMFFIKSDFTKLRHVKKRSGKTVDLSSPPNNSSAYQTQPERTHVPKQGSRINYKPLKIRREVKFVYLGRVSGAQLLKFAYDKKSWFSREQYINHLISKRGLTREFHSLSDSNRNINLQRYSETVWKVVKRLYRKGWVDISLKTRKEGRKSLVRKSVQITVKGGRFWDYLVEEYGSKTLLASNLDLYSANRRLKAPQTLFDLIFGVCIVGALFGAFIGFLLVLNAISSLL